MSRKAKRDMILAARPADHSIAESMLPTTMPGDSVTVPEPVPICYYDMMNGVVNSGVSTKDVPCERGYLHEPYYHRGLHGSWAFSVGAECVAITPDPGRPLPKPLVDEISCDLTTTLRFWYRDWTFDPSKSTIPPPAEYHATTRLTLAHASFNCGYCNRWIDIPDRVTTVTGTIRIVWQAWHDEFERAVCALKDRQVCRWCGQACEQGVSRVDWVDRNQFREPLPRRWHFHMECEASMLAHAERDPQWHYKLRAGSQPRGNSLPAAKAKRAATLFDLQ